MYFSKKSVSSVQCGLRQSPRSWGIFQNFCVKSNLTVCKVTFNCKLHSLLPLLPRFPRMDLPAAIRESKHIGHL